MGRTHGENSHYWSQWTNRKWISNKTCQRIWKENIIASDLYIKEGLDSAGKYIKLDVTDHQELEKIIKKYNITTVYHLASLLSGTSEKQPLLAWNVNLDPLLHLCEMAKNGLIKKDIFGQVLLLFLEEEFLLIM